MVLEKIKNAEDIKKLKRSEYCLHRKLENF